MTSASAPVTFNFADLFEHLADAAGHRPCLVAEPVRRTYAELDERATRLANHLGAEGVGPGEQVAIHSANRIEWVEALLACFKLRAIPINVNYRYVEAEARYLYENADCVAAVVEPEHLPLVQVLQRTLPRLGPVLPFGDTYEVALAAASPERAFEPRSGDDVYVVYTGGTTGMPKGVMWRHEDAFFATASGGRPGGLPINRPEEIVDGATGPQMVYMATTPLMHGGAQWLMFNSLFSGGLCVVSTLRSFDGPAVLETVALERVNALALIGDAMGRPLAEAARDSDLDLSCLVSIGNGGAPLTATVKAELMAALPQVFVTDTFGASETGASGSAAGTDGGPARFSPHPDVTVLDDALSPIPPGSEQVGRLARTGHIPLGYHGDPEKTAATFPTDADGRRWVVPGDFATMEPDGTIVLLGRGSVCINSAGEKIFPEEVEAALRAHPDVYDAVVVGLPDPRWGERCTALVQARPDRSVDDDTLVAHCRTLVAGYKVPKTIFHVDEVAHTTVGKPDYVAAKTTAAALAERAR